MLATGMQCYKGVSFKMKFIIAETLMSVEEVVLVMAMVDPFTIFLSFQEQGFPTTIKRTKTLVKCMLEYKSISELYTQIYKRESEKYRNSIAL